MSLDSIEQIVATLFLLGLVYLLINGSFSSLALGVGIFLVLLFMALKWADY